MNFAQRYFKWSAEWSLRFTQKHKYLAIVLFFFTFYNPGRQIYTSFKQLFQQFKPVLLHEKDWSPRTIPYPVGDTKLNMQ